MLQHHWFLSFWVFCTTAMDNIYITQQYYTCQSSPDETAVSTLGSIPQTIPANWLSVAKVLQECTDEDIL